MQLLYKLVKKTSLLWLLMMIGDSFAVDADNGDGASVNRYVSSIFSDSITTQSNLSLGADHSCAIQNETLRCWGKNTSGQTSVPKLNNPWQVSAGSKHTCALDENGVVCWGSNSYGQMDIPSLKNPSILVSGDQHSCALTSEGVRCWGHNSFGQTGVPKLINPTDIYADGISSCAHDRTGTVCWGWHSDRDENTVKFHNIIPSSPTHSHMCRLGKEVVCSGNNNFGQTDVPNLVNPTEIATGAHHTCALNDTGVICWGKNLYGQTTVLEY
tara:strand:- start:266 stop:1075 length:810 start_codon:yes stop_codon:yes gene_type:complete